MYLIYRDVITLECLVNISNGIDLLVVVKYTTLMSYCEKLQHTQLHIDKAVYRNVAMLYSVDWNLYYL